MTARSRKDQLAVALTETLDIGYLHALRLARNAREFAQDNGVPVGSALRLVCLGDGHPLPVGWVSQQGGVT